MLNIKQTSTVSESSDAQNTLSKIMNSADVMTNQNQVKITKFVMPEFTPADPETLFKASKHIFNANHIDTEETKFSQVLQYLPG